MVRETTSDVGQTIERRANDTSVRLLFKVRDSTLPYSQRNEAINKVFDLWFADYQAEHPWLAAGVPRLVDPSNPAMGGVSTYENAAMAILECRALLRTTPPGAPPEPIYTTPVPAEHIATEFPGDDRSDED